MDPIAACQPTSGPWIAGRARRDARDLDECALRTSLAAREAQGTRARGDDRVQLPVAPWRAALLHAAVADVLSAAAFAMHARRVLTDLACDGLRFGNLETPDDPGAPDAAWTSP